MTTKEIPHIPVERELDLIVSRLEARFAHVSHERVEALVRDSAEVLKHTPIQKFVPLLAEKRASDVLRANARHN